MSSWAPSKYKTKNWPSYNDSLKQRGSLSIVGHLLPVACTFLFHFHWKRTSFFAILEWNSKWKTGSNQMISSNTVSVGTLIEEIKSEWIRENQPPSEFAIVCYLTVYFHSGCPRRVYGWPLKLILKHPQNRNRSSLSIHWHPMRFLVIVPNLCPLFQRFQIRDCRLRGYFDW